MHSTTSQQQSQQPPQHPQAGAQAPQAGQPQYQQPPQQHAPVPAPPAMPQAQQQRAPQQAKATFPHQGLNGGWQSDKDYQERRKMIAKIVHLLQQRKPNAPQEWLKKLPQMAKRLEESLYRSAKSFAEYNDASTLKLRLQQLAVNIGMKTKKLQQHQVLHQQRQQAQASAQQQPIQPSQASAFRQSSTQPLVQPQTTTTAPPPQQPTAQSRMVNMSEINPIMGAPAPAPAAPVQSYNHQPSTSAAQPQPAKAPAPASGTSNGGRNMSDRQQVLRHQQQRLLLLRHAAKCQHEDGQCPVTPHCAGMKRLWKHIAECKNQKCLVPHCVSSRYVLSHYHRCKDVRCPVCGPVREAIHRSHEKQKQMQTLKQRHQQAVQQAQQPGASSSMAPVAAPGALAPPSSSVEPPNKRRKSANGMVPAPGLAQVQRPLLQPTTARSGLPTQIAGARGSMVQAGGRPQVAAVPGLAFSHGQVITPKHSGPKPQEDHTLINCFSVEQIETHIATLSQGLRLPPAQLKAKCMDVLKVLQSHQHAWVFNTPVDPVELGLPDYFEVIKKPMDLGTIRKKLENGVYHSLEVFRDNVVLTFDNAMLYNPEGSVVYTMAKEMKDKFELDYAKLLQQLEAEEDIKRRNGEACSLCGCEKLLFEPPVFYCNGMNCPSKRIRRNGYYYVGGNNQYHWCQQCFQELRDGVAIDLGDVQVRKEALLKKKNDEVHEESWVQCDRCERWVHQICALFNTRQNKDQRSEYACPRCTIAERKKNGDLGAKSSTPMAEDLPRTKLSEYLECHVREKVDEYVEKAAKDKAQLEGISIEEAKKKVQMGGAITIRQVTSMDRKLEVRDRMKKRYEFKNYPDEFSFRCKCIVVFQNLDGVDVMLFGLYVYEHDEKNPKPNQRTVYISYLDSVHFMRPRQMRTFIYHEILLSYLDYVRRRGFATAHIWACPPLKGDDYILYAKPEDQKTPKDDRLRQWYIDMLIEAQKRGIVGKLTNMYDLYFSDPKNDATIVPYMDGDYFPAEVENIIKDIEDGKSGKKGSSQSRNKKKDKKAKQKKKSGRGGTRSTGLDEEALKASGFVPPGGDTRPLEEGGRDYVMVKLGETIHPMKESFIVAFLNWKGASEEVMEVPKEIAEYREKHNITWKLDASDSGPKLKSAVAAEKVSENGPKVDDGPPKEPAKDAPSEKADAMAVEPEKKAEDDKKETAADSEKKPSGDANATNSEQRPSVEAKEAGPETKPTDVAKETDEAQKKAPADATEASSEQKQPADSKEADSEKKPSDEAKEADSEKKPSDDAKEAASEQKPTGDSKEAASEQKPSGDKDVEMPDAAKKEANESAGRPSEDKKEADGNPAVVDSAPTANLAKADETANPAESEGTNATKPASTAAAADPKSESEPKGESGPAPMEGVTKTDEPSAASAPADKPAEILPDAPTEGEEKKDDQTSADKKPEATSSSPAPAPAQSANLKVREGKFAAMAARKRDLEGNLKDEESAKEEKDEKKDEKEPEAITVKDSKGRLVKVLDDDDEELDCEFLNNRQAFLNLCQGNHYQFDHLRRAKHSSMMVLWHLHNRDAPKFVSQCATCSREILQGYRFHCPTCADFDQCQECMRNPNIARHPHPLKPIPVATGQQSELSEAQRKERQRSIQLHMTLLLHAATCNNPKCPSANCTKMKGLLKHGAQCKIKAAGGCNVCKRIWALLQIHARQCKAKTCPVPNCMAIRERVRQLKKQQQAMDDRRRQEMNRAYRGKR